MNAYTQEVVPNGIKRDYVLAAMARGEITPDDASTIASVLEARRRALETVELEKRLDILEKAKGN